jgi:signal transduction histidine kinase/DNA-binding response OmpR family regulator
MGLLPEGERMSTIVDADKTSILIVDDMPEKLLVYQAVLEELGQNLVWVLSGPEALKQVLRTDFAVILLDVQMPEMDGFETARFIRQRKRSAHTPIIFLTAFSDEMRLAEGYAHGAVDYILTPVVPEVLRAKVRVFVELFRMRRQVAQQAEEQARRAAAEEVARRSAFLAEASRTLTSTLDFDATLRGLARLTVPTLADVSFVCLADEQGGLSRAEWAWDDPARGTVLQPAAPGPPPHPSLAGAVARVFASGSAEHLGCLDPPVPAAEGGATLPQLVLRWALVLPLVARDKTLGVLGLALGPSGRHFEPGDLSTAADLASRAGIALDNALLVRDIQDNDRRKNEFLAMLAHELRNPLAPVWSAVEVLRLKGTADPELNWARDVIDRQVRHLVRLVDDLLDVSRITRGKIKLYPEVLDVAGVVASAVETSRPLVEAHAHLLAVSLPEGPLRVHADPARLTQVLTNLLNNAAKYTPDGGQIWLSAAPDGGEAVFRVRDTGAGIPRDMLSKVFDLFTQVDRSLDRSEGGLGIGLTLVRRLVELHGGRVAAFSEGPGRGSEFVVRLPLLSSESGPSTVAGGGAAPGADSIKAPCRVLVVDDNTSAADGLAVLLRLSGHEVQLAHDGETALEAAGTFRPDVILLDIGLPGVDGYEVARRLRAQPASREVMLVAISGYGQDDDLERSRQAGFDHHFIKPVDFSTLRVVLPGRGETGARRARSSAG